MEFSEKSGINSKFHKIAQICIFLKFCPKLNKNETKIVIRLINEGIRDV